MTSERKGEAVSNRSDEGRKDEASWVRVGSREDGQVLEKNWLFTLAKERFRSRHSSKAHDFYVIDLADAVHVIALTPDDEVILVKQFRAGSGRDSLEIPGGLVDPGEDPCKAGARELAEETGYTGDPPEMIGALWSNPSIVTSRITTIVIRNARKTAEPHLDATEELTVEKVPARDIPRLIQEGKIDHAHVVSGLLWWLGQRQGLFGPNGFK